MGRSALLPDIMKDETLMATGETLPLQANVTIEALTIQLNSQTTTKPWLIRDEQFETAGIRTIETGSHGGMLTAG